MLRSMFPPDSEWKLVSIDTEEFSETYEWNGNLITVVLDSTEEGIELGCIKNTTWRDLSDWDIIDYYVKKNRYKYIKFTGV